MRAENHVHIVVIGAGMVGLAIASRLARASRDIIVLERNKRPGEETSSRSSEVLHVGMYYAPGSRKATMCVNGSRELYTIAEQESIPHKRVGKYIVATTPAHIPLLERYQVRGTTNGVCGLQIYDGTKLARSEPHVRGLAALYSPNTGIIDTASLLQYFRAKATSGGAHILCNHTVVGIEHIGERYRVTVRDPNNELLTVRTPVVVNSAGLASSAIAFMVGISTEPLEFWKGEYFSIQGSTLHVNHLIYPLPDTSNGGLGIHLTMDLGGRMRLGPNAFRVSGIDYRVDESHRQEFYDAAMQYLRPGILEPAYLQPDTAGIRPRLPRKNGELQDFYIQHETDAGLPGFINLLGIESPGITAAPAIARYVEDIVNKILG